MHRIGPLDNSRKTYFDFTGIETDEEFKKFCSYFEKFDSKILIRKLNDMNQLKQQNYKQYHGGFTLSNFDSVKQYIERLLHIGHYYNEKKKLVFKMQQYNDELKEIEREIETKTNILESRGIKNHGLNNMPNESKLKHIRNCVGCNNVAKFNMLTDEEILNNKIVTDTDKIKTLNYEVQRINFEIVEYNEKIKDIKDKVYPFTKHLMNTYLMYKVFVQDSDDQNNKITFCVDIGNVVVEVPFTEIIAKAIEGYAKEEFRKKL